MSVLDGINDQLKAIGIDFRLQKEGIEKGEWKILNFLGHTPVTKFLTILEFAVNPPTEDNHFGKPQKFIMLASNNTAVDIILVNDEYVILTWQHRPIFGRWIYELVRGWYWNKPDNPLDIVQRKLPQLLGDKEKGIEGIARLASDNPVENILERLPEDTGMRTNVIDTYLVRVTSEIEVDKGRTFQEALQKRLRDTSLTPEYIPWVFSIAELDRELIKLMARKSLKSNRGLTDALSVAAWTAYYFWRSNLSEIRQAMP